MSEVTITIDGKDYQVEADQNLLQVVLSAKLDLPYFCWHPSLGSVGACRQCAVVQFQNEEDERGRIAMACMTQVTEGLRVSIDAEAAASFRTSVIEWLMENHPHDCPVCEEGGECHLQDMTVMSGHSMRQYRGQKRSWENQYLGPLLNHEMNRCITCFRCVRFYGDYAGGTDLQALGSRSRMYFGRTEDGVLENEFAGNLVEVCPTGVFTDKPFSKTYSRKWDLRSAPSICAGCSAGCNTSPGERYGVLKRVHNRFNNEVNGYFLCDRGRFGVDYVNNDERIRKVGKRLKEDVFEPIDTDLAMSLVVEHLGVDPVGIGSPRASLESNLSLRAFVGEENFCPGLGDEQVAIERALSAMKGALQVANIKAIEQADAVIVLGEDVANSAPRISLAIRQSVRNKSLQMATEAGIAHWQDSGVRGHAQNAKTPLIILSMLETRLDDIASWTLRDHPQELAQIANSLAEDNPTTRGLRNTLVNAKRPLVVCGTGAGEPALIDAAIKLAESIDNCAFVCVAPEVNSMGAAIVGGGLSLDAALARMATGAGAIVLENDLYRRADAKRVTEALEAATFVVGLDCLPNKTMDAVDIVLPSATSVESTGTFVNYETRAQRYYQVFEPSGDVAASWQWLTRLAQVFGREDMQWANIEAVCAATGFGSLAAVAPGAEYRGVAGMKLARAPQRYSGRTAMTADVSVHEPKTALDEKTPFSHSMEGLNDGQPGAAVPFVWAPGWNSNQAVSKYQTEIGGDMSGTPAPVFLIDEFNVSGSPTIARPEGFVTTGELQTTPLQDAFISDELAIHSAALIERGGHPYLVLHPHDAESFGVVSADGVLVDGASYVVRINSLMAEGAVGMINAQPGGFIGELTLDPDYQKPPEVIVRG